MWALVIERVRKVRRCGGAVGRFVEGELFEINVG